MTWESFRNADKKIKALYGIAACLILLGMGQFLLTARYITTHESTTGRVVDSATAYGGSTEDGGSVSRNTAAVIEYSLPDGSKSTFTSFRTSSDVHPPAGLSYQSEVTVYYSPDNPYDARAGDFLSLWRIPLVIFLLGAGCFGFALFASR
jgi:hypothetical protein